MSYKATISAASRSASAISRASSQYFSYLLRLWRVGTEKAVWRASLESPHTGERIPFASLDALFAFLQQQTNDDTEEET